MALGPLKKVFLDIFYMTQFSTFQYALIAIDQYSNYIFVEPLKCMTSDAVLNGIFKMFRVTGLPERIRTDNQSSFRTKHFIQQLGVKGTMIETIIPYRSNANIAERAVRTTRSALAKLEKPWYSEEVLYMLNIKLNMLSRNRHGFSPYETLFGFEMDKRRILGLKIPNKDEEIQSSKINYEATYNSIKERNKEKNEKIELYHKKALNRISIGDIVKYRKEGSKSTELGSGVVKEIDSVEIILQDLNYDHLLVRHITDILN